MLPSTRELCRALEARDESAVARLIGFEVPPRAGLWKALDEGLTHLDAAHLVRSAARGAAPAVGLTRLLELSARLVTRPRSWDRDGRRALGVVLGGSHAVARYLAAHPQFALPIVEGRWLRQPKDLATMQAETRTLRAASRDIEALERALAGYRTREWCRIVARDLARLAPVEEVLEELSHLAEAIIDPLTRFTLRRERSKEGQRWERAVDGLRASAFSVLAMGKLGATGLNLSSDVDLLFVYSTDEAPAEAERTLHQRYSAVAKGIVAGLSRRTAEGWCYRVDTDLRPEGTRGPLVNSIAGAERYYETWGQNWERLALARARPIAGARWVGHQFARTVRPFVFPRTFDTSTIDEIRAMHTRAFEERLSRAARRGRSAGVDVKRDPGGIREVELFVQILQLLHGGRVPGLQSRELLEAIEHLHFAGLIDALGREELRDSYRYLRRVENVLQAVEEQQTHELPREEAGCLHVARLLRMRLRGDDPTRSLHRAVDRHRRRVRRTTRGLFGEAPERPRRDLATQALRSAPKQRATLLKRMGFLQPAEAAGVLSSLEAAATGPFSPRAPEKHRALAAPLLDTMAGTADPDLALRSFAELNAQLRRHPGYRDLLAIPPLRQRLLDLLGSSEHLGRSIVRSPELIDWLSHSQDPVRLARRRGASTLAGELRARLESLDTNDLELLLRSVGRFRLRELLRIGALDLAGELDVSAVMTQLCDLAEACLQIVFELARRAAAERTGESFDRGFCVLGMGRFGYGEMGYGSDLDLIFIFDETRQSAERTGTREAAARLGQKLIALLTGHIPEGAIYPIDTRLRPSGQQGPLVSSAGGFIHYQRERAMVWERQALLCARPVAGDRQLGTRLMRELAPIRFPAQLPDDARGELTRIRTRMEREIARETGSHVNPKTGRGGLTDIVFIVQYLLLRHGHHHPQLRDQGICATLEGLDRLGLLASSHARHLREAYTFLRFLENRLRMVHDRAVDGIDLESPSLLVLARRMGYGRDRRSTARLRRDYVRITTRVRRTYDAIMGPPGESNALGAR